MENQIKSGDVVITSSPASLEPSFHYFPQTVHFYAKNNLKGIADQVVQSFGARKDRLSRLLILR